MEHVLGRALAKDRHFALNIIKLEATHDSASIDVELIGEIISRVTALHRALLLDPSDTKDDEFYYTLRKHIADDNERLAGAIGGRQGSVVSEMNPLIMSFLQKYFSDQTCFSIKASVLKKLLKKNPPRKLMALLNYRSVDSLLKHESPQALVVLARYVESYEWLEEYNKSLRLIKAQDFEEKKIEIVLLDKAALVKQLALSSLQHNLVLHAKEAGIIAIAPTNERVIRSYTIRTLALAIHYVNEILIFSSYAKHVLTYQSFGEEIYKTISSRGDRAHTKVAGIPINWRVVHKHMNTSGDANDLMPHVQLSDWAVHSAQDTLSDVSNILLRWIGNEYVTKLSENPVSCNVIDLSIDDSNESLFSSRSLKYVRRELESEMMQRYLANPRIREVVLRRLRIF